MRRLSPSQLTALAKIIADAHRRGEAPEIIIRERGDGRWLLWMLPILLGSALGLALMMLWAFGLLGGAT